ncbi:MAG: ABC transporter substrate-binding protein [Deltaproteobacteria bacterium]|nr:MAG: ABC transporter substrate-binding protein [Deltaproteobacteria bacterium]
MRAGLLAACVLLAACAVPLDPPPSGPPARPDEVPRPGGTLRLGAAEDVHTLDPAIGYDTGSWAFEQMLFNTLVDYDEGTTIVPELAESWEVSPDGLHFAFTLRSGVRFSSGRALAAADVKYSLERLLRPALHSPGAEFFAGLAGVDEYVHGRSPEVRGITTPAANRVEFALAAVDPLFLHKLAMPFASVVDREAVERVGDLGFRRQPVGSGAFVLAEWVEGQRMRLARNPLYFRSGLPYLDGIEVTVGLSDQLGWFKYQRGEIDISGVPSAEFARVVADARYQPLLLERTTLRTQYLGLNCALPPFDQAAVRQAMNMAVNKQRLLDLIDGRGVVATTILPPDMPGYDSSTLSYPFDPAGARARLEAAGLGHGFATTLWASRDEGSMRLGQSLQQDLRAIGVELALKPVDFPTLIEAVRHPGMAPLFLLGWEADFPDPSNFLIVLLHSRSRGTNNNAFYANPEVDRLLDEAEPLLEPGRRLPLFHDAEVMIMRDAPWVPLFHPVGFAIRHPRVRNYQLHPLRPSRVETVWLAG